LIAKFVRACIAGLGAAVLVAGCGGGGGDPGGSGPVTSTSAFPLLAAYKAYLIAGINANFTVSGTCSGTATLVSSPTATATFEGVTGYASTDTTTITFTNCTPSSSTNNGFSYYDANYTPLGESVTGEEYAKFNAAATPLPASVKVGDTGTVGTLTVYADSTKATITGISVVTYVIEPDTGSTAIVNLIEKDYDNSNRLTLTQQSRYRITLGGTATPTSIDLQESTTGSTHLVLTRS